MAGDIIADLCYNTIEECSQIGRAHYEHLHPGLNNTDIRARGAQQRFPGFSAASFSLVIFPREPL